jgi:hypothetical protein
MKHSILRKYEIVINEKFCLEGFVEKNILRLIIKMGRGVNCKLKLFLKSLFEMNGKIQLKS